MEKPDFESIKTLIGTIGYLDKTFDDIFAEGEEQIEFDNFANESVVACAFDNLMDKEWIQRVIEEESRKQANHD